MFVQECLTNGLLGKAQITEEPKQVPAGPAAGGCAEGAEGRREPAQPRGSGAWGPEDPEGNRSLSEQRPCLEQSQRDRLWWVGEKHQLLELAGKMSLRF